MGFSFCFNITLQKSCASKEVIFKNNIVTFGKESMPFKMDVEKQAVNKEEKQQESGNALFLLSDTYVASDIAEHSILAVADTTAFRNVINNISQRKEDYYNRVPAKTPNSKRLQLLKKGSLFFHDDIDSIANPIKTQKQFEQIGYNKFQFTNINVLS